MRITCDSAKREWTIQTRGLDMRRAREVFAGPHFTRPDERWDYGEPRFTTAGWLDAELIVFVWTRGVLPDVLSA